MKLFERVGLVLSLVVFLACTVTAKPQPPMPFYTVMLSVNGGAATKIKSQTLPLSVNVGWDQDTSATAPMGYYVQLDGVATTTCANPVTLSGTTACDIGMPTLNPSCKAFVGGAAAPCLETAVAIPTAGAHTISVSGYNLGGVSPVSSITANVTAPSGKPGNGRIVK